MNAVHSDAPEVGDMILSLSNQLKYVIDYGEEWVSLGRDFRHLKDYFYIIEVRFEQQYELRIDIGEEVDPAWLIPKLSLQPLVENAVQHGLLPKGKGAVEVSVRRREDRLVIAVVDDGVGMEPGELEAIRQMLSRKQAPSGSVGMKNVHERIRSLCGEGYGISIASWPHVGTSVTIEIPVKEALADAESRNRG